MDKIKQVIIVPYTTQFKVLLWQYEFDHLFNEEWGFGRAAYSDEEDTAITAARILREELDFETDAIEYYGSLTKQVNNKELTYEIHVVEIQEDLLQFDVAEGIGIEFYQFPQARELAIIKEIDLPVLDHIQTFILNKQQEKK